MRPRHHALCRVAVVVWACAGLAGCHDADPGGDRAQVLQAVAAIEGIAQERTTLGVPTAPWSLTVIAGVTSYDLDHMITQLPAVAERFVRPGRLSVRMSTPVSGAYARRGQAALVAGALFEAGLQGRYWDVLVRFVPTQRDPVRIEDVARLLRDSGARISRRGSLRMSPRARAALARSDAAAVAASGKGRIVYLLGWGSGPARDITSDAQEGRLAESIALAIAARRVAAGDP